MRGFKSLLKVAKVLGWRYLWRSRHIKRISQDTLRGYFTTRVIVALFNLGLFDELRKQERVNLVRFAERNNIDLDVLQILCNYLYEQKFLKRQGQDHTLDSDGLLIAESMGGIYDLAYAYEDLLYNLEPMLRKEKTYGADVLRRSEFVAKGSGSIGKLLAFPILYEEIIRHNFHRILDMGCGDATFIVDLCRRSRKIRGYGLDIAPEAIALGKEQLKREGIQDRVQLFFGDIFDIDLFVEQFQEIEVGTFVYVLHEFQDQIVAVLSKFRMAFPKIPLIICEVIQHSPEELRKKPGNIAEIQFFHELSNQRLFTLEEWRKMFGEAGFSNIEENYLDFVRTCIYTIS